MKEMCRRMAVLGTPNQSRGFASIDWRPLPQILTPGACPAGAAVHFGVRGHGGLRRY